MAADGVDIPRGPWRLHVVPHTHWDREWHQPLEAFRIRLAHTIDEIVDVLERDPRMCFTLDGQSVLLEDYVEYRPDARSRERLQALLASRRIAVGPLYVQPDEVLVGGESLVRNLLIGQAVCRRFGAAPAQIGYAPDSFGHVAQMPQVLRGFGLDHFIFMRGLGSEGDAAGALLRWEGPDGTRVVAVPLLSGYDSASSLGIDEDGRFHFITDPALWPDAAARRVRRLLAGEGPRHVRSRLRDVLLCNGVDHRRIQHNLPEMLDACVERIPGIEYRICRYGDYMATVREQLPRLRLRTVRGELVGGRYQNVLRGINSSRLELKQANHDVERLLQSSETLAALASLAGDYPFPREAFEVAWRHLLRNHAHDSIGGCSVDQVHRDMLHRFDRVRQIADRLGQEALLALAGAGADAVWHWTESPSPQRTLVNVLPWRRRRSVELPITDELAGSDPLVARVDGGEEPVQVVGPRDARRAVVVADLPPLGARTLELAPGRAEPEDVATATGPRRIENRFLGVTVAADGALTLLDRESGRRWTGLHVFEDRADRGDEYTFCPLEGETPWTSAGADAEVRVVEPGPLRAELEVRLPLALPASLSRDRRRRIGSATCVAFTRVRLEAGIDRVELSTRLVNRASDHRLRVLFPDRTGDPRRVRAQSAFAVVERPARPEWDERWFEPPHLTNHTAGLVRAGELCLMTLGLPEYEAIPRRRGGVDLALTLIRSVGALSRDDLSTRRGHAGPLLPTPDAQGLGERTCAYAIRLARGADDAELVRAAEDYRFVVADAPGVVDLEGVLDLAGDRFALSALKGAEDGDGLVLRVYNPGGRRARLRVGGALRSVERCRLDESGGEPVDGAISLGPYEIATLRVRPERRRRRRPSVHSHIPIVPVPPE